MDPRPASDRCDICRRREPSNTWSTFDGDRRVRERHLCDVCVRVRAALSRAHRCANCLKQDARRFRLRFAPGGMFIPVWICRQCWVHQDVVDRLHRRIKGVVKRRGTDDEGGLQRDIEKLLGGGDPGPRPDGDDVE